jgi:hypothetical protein
MKRDDFFVSVNTNQQQVLTADQLTQFGKVVLLILEDETKGRERERLKFFDILINVFYLVEGKIDHRQELKDLQTNLSTNLKQEMVDAVWYVLVSCCLESIFKLVFIK